MATLTGGEFVGRQREMGKLKAALEDALSGQGRLVMLAGEPGIGKTRTAQELAAHAETRGAQVLWGWCYEEEGAPPYWPWLQPLRAYVQQRDPEQLQSEMGPGAADIADLVSEVRSKLPNLEPPPALPPEQARFRLFGSITTFLRNAAQSQPLMLILDDLHWADKPSLLLLQFLARQLTESPLLVVGCYRDLELSRQHPLSEALAQLSRLPVFQRELLLGISQEDTSQFIEMMAGIRPSLQLVEIIHAHTEGNPFFLKEMTRLLSEQGELRAAEIAGPEGIRIPQGVREVIGQRLNRLSEACHETLTIASIIGREFDFRLLRTLSNEISDEQLLGVIDEALAARLIEELPGGRERYRFSHSLIQQTLAEELSVSRKVRWHAQIGEALEELYGVDGEAHAAELAYHFAKAEPVLGPGKLVHYSLLAGEGALAAYAWEEALEHFQQGLAAKEGQPTDAETIKLLFGLGRAQAATLELHHVQEAVATLSRALDYCAEAKDVNQAVAVAEYHLPAVAARYGAATQLVPRALKLVPPDSHAAGQLLSRYGWELGRFQRNHEGAQEAFNQALAIAHRDKDEILEMWTLARGAHVDYLHCCYEEAIGKGLQSLELANRLDIPQAGGLALSSLALTLLTVGDPSGARHGEAALEISKRLHDRNEQPQLLLVALSWSLAQGDWHNAQVLIDRALAVSPHGPMFPTYKGLLACELGDFQQGETILGQVINTLGRNPGDATARRAHIAISIALAARITDKSAWASSTEALAESVFSTHETPRIFRIATGAQALLAILKKEDASVVKHYASLESARSTLLGANIVADHLLGLLAQTLGNPDKATEHFEEALIFCHKAGYRPELAWTCYDYAEVLLQRGHPGDHARAMPLLEESLAIAQELGMRPLAERVVTLQQQSQPRSLIPAYPDGLSQREVEVLGLIALGKSNRQIAEGLFISLNTVERHVSNIFAKTRTGNRADATRYAIRNGLVT